MDPEPDEIAAALVGDLVQAARVPAKRRPFPVKLTVERLTSLAYEHGLLPETLRALVEVITTPGHLDQASLGALTRHLYPAGAAVADEVVLRVVGSLGQGALKPSVGVQALLLRWLILAYPVVAHPGLLSRAYGVLFGLLDTAGLRAPLCHLLALITRRRHVRPFRIQAMLQLAWQTGHDPHLVGLLRVFKNYYPEVIVGEATRGRASPFKHPDPQWRVQLEAIRRARQQNGSGGGGSLDTEAQNGFRVRQNLGLGGKLPSVHTAHAQETSVTLEEMDSAAGLVQHLETVELPSQLVAVLADPLLQKLLQLRPSDEAYARVDNWMGAVIDSAADDESSQALLDLLEVVHDYVTSTQTFPPVLDRFFAALLQTWDGQAKKALLLESLSLKPVVDFEDVYRSLYRPLEARLLDNGVASQLDLLSFYTLVVHAWTVSVAASEAAASAAGLPAFVEHVNGLVLAVAQNGPSAGGGGVGGGVSLAAALAVLDFYEAVAGLLRQGGELLEHVQAAVPPPAVVYALHFSGSAAVASRLYAVLAAYKRALEAAMARRPNRQLPAQERGRVNLFNGFLMDVCNCLWRSRAFTTADTNAQGCRVPPALVPTLVRYVQGLDRDLALSSAFSLPYSPTLCLQAIAYLRELEDAAIEAAERGPESGALYRRHAGPVTQPALLQLASSGGLSVSWQDYRTGLLSYLERKGFGGVSALMYNTMKNLMNARQTSSAASAS